MGAPLYLSCSKLLRTPSKLKLLAFAKKRVSRVLRVQHELNKVNISMKHRVTFITEGDGDPGVVRDELRTLEARKRDLE